MKKLYLIVAIVTCLAMNLCGCSNSNGNQDSEVINVAEDAPRYSMKSLFSDWEAEFAVTYTDVKHVPFLHGHYALAIVEIVNTGNKPIYTFDLRYHGHTLADKEGKQESISFTDNYPNVLEPGMKGYLFCSNSTFGDWDKPTELELKLEFDTTADTVLQGDEVFSSFKISEVKPMVNDNGSIVLKGKVTNDTKADGKNVHINAVVFDNTDKPLCIASCMINSLKAGETINFEALSYTVGTIALEDIASWKIEAYSNW